MEDNELGRHVFCFNKKDNGGESLVLITKIFSLDDDDDEENRVYFNQDLVLNSYCNCASMSFQKIQITPDILRKLANELESEIIKAQNKKFNCKKVRS